MSKRQKFTPEFRAEAVELVISSQKSLVEVAASLSINEGTLGNWVRTYRTEHPEAETEERGPVEWAQYEKLRKELLEVKRKNDFFLNRGDLLPAPDADSPRRSLLDQRLYFPPKRRHAVTNSRISESTTSSVKHSTSHDPACRSRSTGNIEATTHPFGYVVALPCPP